MTEEHKNIIKRDYIATLLSETFGVKKQSEMLLKFVSLHFPEKVAEIQKVHDDVYETKHQNTLKRIAELEKIADAVNGGIKQPVEEKGKGDTDLDEIKINNEYSDKMPDGNDDFDVMNSNSAVFEGEINPVEIDSEVMEFAEFAEC